MTGPGPAATRSGATTADVGVDRSALMHNYAEPAVTFVRGEGSVLYDTAGKPYLDFLSGLAVTSLGHAHPVVAEAVAEQARTLSHVSNLFGNTVGPEVAVTLDRLIGGGTERAGGQVFFGNSGAEANECALKLARRWAGPGRFAVVCTCDAFHGRTLATLAATGQPEKQQAFEPLPEGFDHVPFDDLDAMDAACDPVRVVAVMVEPMLGEAGVVVPSSDYLVGLRQLCTDRDILLIVDEVQTGLGRTGRWFGFQHLGVEPDIVTMAKALGNGMPVGACWARAEVAAAFVPGDHGSTFGGQPLAMSAARATLAVMESEDVPTRARAAGSRLRAGLEGLPGVVAVRGEGLLLAAVLSGPYAAAACRQALDEGLIVNAPKADVLRLAPSLLVSDGEIDRALIALGRVLARSATSDGPGVSGSRGPDTPSEGGTDGH
jgi:predicted acetylornithine/succinylornithine family transaminase